MGARPHGQRGTRARPWTVSVHTALFRRLFLINGLVFTVGTLVGLAVILAANAVLVRTSLAPLGSLATLMQRVDLLRHDDRLTDGGNGDLTHLIRTFNEMLDRLEAEWNAASAHALAAQEGERQRIARELHDEIGQSLTVVLLGLKRVVDRAPDDLAEELRGVAEGVRGSLDEVRGVARRLRPGVLSDLGLHSALIALSSEFSPTTTRSSAAGCG